ncbi:hypothetical protein DENSPDRAFT_885969 [Dentipellis sp. KUC8613]|nr:hypothetical protein DENSPDRAFT_885969 [Dentipellis sp. KUC8613]
MNSTRALSDDWSYQLGALAGHSSDALPAFNLLSPTPASRTQSPSPFSDFVSPNLGSSGHIPGAGSPSTLQTHAASIPSLNSVRGMLDTHQVRESSVGSSDQLQLSQLIHRIHELERENSALTDENKKLKSYLDTVLSHLRTSLTSPKLEPEQPRSMEHMLPELPSRDRRSFPYVLHWTHEDWKEDLAAKKGLTTVEGANDGGGGGNVSSVEATNAKEVNTLIHYLVDRQGIVITFARFKAIAQLCRSVWRQLLLDGTGPAKWGEISYQALQYYTRAIIGKFEEFSFCENNWKLMLFTSYYYPVWYRNQKIKPVQANPGPEPIPRPPKRPNASPPATKKARLMKSAQENQADASVSVPSVLDKRASNLFGKIVFRPDIVETAPTAPAPESTPAPAPAAPLPAAPLPAAPLPAAPLPAVPAPAAPATPAPLPVAPVPAPAAPAPVPAAPAPAAPAPAAPAPAAPAPASAAPAPAPAPAPGLIPDPAPTPVSPAHVSPAREPESAPPASSSKSSPTVHEKLAPENLQKTVRRSARRSAESGKSSKTQGVLQISNLINASNMYAYEWQVDNPTGSRYEFNLVWKALSKDERNKYKELAKAKLLEKAQASNAGKGGEL